MRQIQIKYKNMLINALKVAIVSNFWPLQILQYFIIQFTFVIFRPGVQNLQILVDNNVVFIYDKPS